MYVVKVYLSKMILTGGKFSDVNEGIVYTNLIQGGNIKYYYFMDDSYVIINKFRKNKYNYRLPCFLRYLNLTLQSSK